MRIKAQELRDRVRKKKEEEEKKMERQRERERIRANKELTEAKRTTEANERERYLVSWKAEKEEEKRARERILQKLEQDKVERRFGVRLPPERLAALKSSPLQGKELQNSVPVKSVTKAEQMRECLRSLKCNHQVNDFALFFPTCSQTRSGSLYLTCTKERNFTTKCWHK
ncbi:uncharacterized protein LOC132165939 isoform X4 [Corylus avellana]|nr:uncharacterized protein LOC132165939 isoform X4 [Corylus avellana]XP_059432640.1 uncharacterized protein LOC132165939 isoform X4 [Corylus avellana]